MKPSIAIPVSIGGAFALAVLATFGLAVADLRRDEVVMALWPWVGRLWTGLCGVLPLLILIAGCYGLWQLGAGGSDRPGDLSIPQE